MTQKREYTITVSDFNRLVDMLNDAEVPISTISYDRLTGVYSFTASTAPVEVSWTSGCNHLTVSGRYILSETFDNIEDTYNYLTELIPTQL